MSKQIFNNSDNNSAILQDILGDALLLMERVGSRETCNPPPTDTDEDYLVLVRSDPKEALVAAGFQVEGSPEFYTGNDRGNFLSWRRGDVNLIVTDQPDFFDLFNTATYLAKRFNLLKKADRIALFQAVLYRVPYYNLEMPVTSSLMVEELAA